MPRRTYFLALALSLLVASAPGTAPAAAFSPDHSYLRDREALDELQRSAFTYIWERGDPDSGMAYETEFDWPVRPVAVGGTGFGVAAIVVAVDRGWVGRDQAVARLNKITAFLRDKVGRAAMHGAFPHWLNGKTGEAVAFGDKDSGADIVETSLLMQGLLIARAYFNGPGPEEELRRTITGLWKDVDWNWFTNGEENGLYWHWDAKTGFSGLKILGYNECLITYLLAAASPTHPISRKAYDYWTSGDNYQARDVYGYRVEATPAGGGPLFLAQYSFIGLDPRRIADSHVKEGYFVRGIKQTLANRAYALQDAPPENRYADDFWGLTASRIKGGYAANCAFSDNGTVAPTAALSAMPYTPHYSLQVLGNLRGGLRKRAWGPCGPYDAISLREDWVGEGYLAIDQLPIVCMVENYRSGLLWRLFMGDPDIRGGLKRAGFAEPEFAAGFPEAVVTIKKDASGYSPDACDLRRHPDTGMYAIPFWSRKGGTAHFTMASRDGEQVFEQTVEAAKGRNYLVFPQFMPPDGQPLTLTLRQDGEGESRLPIRLY